MTKKKSKQNSIFARNTKTSIAEWTVEEMIEAFDEMDKKKRIKVYKCSKSVGKGKSPEVYDEEQRANKASQKGAD